jgi:hypothetical protein
MCKKNLANRDIEMYFYNIKQKIAQTPRHATTFNIMESFKLTFVRSFSFKTNKKRKLKKKIELNFLSWQVFGMFIKKQFFINSCKQVSDSGDQNFKENLMLESFNKVVDNMSFKKCNSKAIWSYNE